MKHLFLALLCLVITTPSYAQTVGSSCSGSATGANVQTIVSSRYVRLVCDGTTWQELNNYGLGSSSTAATTLEQIGYDSGSCTAIKSGRLRFTAPNKWEYCNGTAWTEFEMAPAVSNLICWGHNDPIEPKIIQYLPFTYTYINGGAGSFCGIIKASGRAVCLPNPAPSDLTNVYDVAGGDKSCAIKSDRSGTCWDSSGTTLGGLPASLTGANDLAKISAYRYFGNQGCALKTNGSVICWGDNSVGQANPPALTNATQIWTGYQYSCVLKSDGTIACWGDGNSSIILSSSGISNAIDMSAGSNSACAIIGSSPAATQGSLSCWGDNSYGKVSGAPAGSNYIDVAVGNQTACAVTASGSVSCWGNSDNNRTNVPAGITTAVSVTINYGNACARIQ